MACVLSITELEASELWEQGRLRCAQVEIPTKGELLATEPAHGLRTVKWEKEFRIPLEFPLRNASGESTKGGNNLIRIGVQELKFPDESDCLGKYTFDIDKLYHKGQLALNGAPFQTKIELNEAHGSGWKVAENKEGKARTLKCLLGLEVVYKLKVKLLRGINIPPPMAGQHRAYVGLHVTPNLDGLDMKFSKIQKTDNCDYNEEFELPVRNPISSFLFLASCHKGEEGQGRNVGKARIPLANMKNNKWYKFSPGFHYQSKEVHGYMTGPWSQKDGARLEFEMMLTMVDEWKDETVNTDTEAHKEELARVGIQNEETKAWDEILEDYTLLAKVRSEKLNPQAERVIPERRREEERDTESNKQEPNDETDKMVTELSRKEGVERQHVSGTESKERCSMCMQFEEEAPRVRAIPSELDVLQHLLNKIEAHSYVTIDTDHENASMPTATWDGGSSPSCFSQEGRLRGNGYEISDSTITPRYPPTEEENIPNQGVDHPMAFASPLSATTATAASDSRRSERKEGVKPPSAGFPLSPSPDLSPTFRLAPLEDGIQPSVASPSERRESETSKAPFNDGMQPPIALPPERREWGGSEASFNDGMYPPDTARSLSPQMADLSRNSPKDATYFMDAAGDIIPSPEGKLDKSIESLIQNCNNLDYTSTNVGAADIRKFDGSSRMYSIAGDTMEYPKATSPSSPPSRPFSQMSERPYSRNDERFETREKRSNLSPLTLQVRPPSSFGSRPSSAALSRIGSRPNSAAPRPTPLTQSNTGAPPRRQSLYNMVGMGNNMESLESPRASGILSPQPSEKDGKDNEVGNDPGAGAAVTIADLDDLPLASNIETPSRDIIMAQRPPFAPSLPSQPKSGGPTPNRTIPSSTPASAQPSSLELDISSNPGFSPIDDSMDDPWDGNLYLATNPISYKTRQTLQTAKDGVWLDAGRVAVVVEDPYDWKGPCLMLYDLAVKRFEDECTIVLDREGPKAIMALTSEPHNQFLAVGKGNEVVVVDCQTWANKRYKTPGGITALAFSPCSTMLAMGHSNQLSIISVSAVTQTTLKSSLRVTIVKAMGFENAQSVGFCKIVIKLRDIKSHEKRGNLRLPLEHSHSTTLRKRSNGYCIWNETFDLKMDTWDPAQWLDVHVSNDHNQLIAQGSVGLSDLVFNDNQLVIVPVDRDTVRMGQVHLKVNPECQASRLAQSETYSPSSKQSPKSIVYAPLKALYSVDIPGFINCAWAKDMHLVYSSSDNIGSIPLGAIASKPQVWKVGAPCTKSQSLIVSRSGKILLGLDDGRLCAVGPEPSSAISNKRINALSCPAPLASTSTGHILYSDDDGDIAAYNLHTNRKNPIAKPSGDGSDAKFARHKKVISLNTCGQQVLYRIHLNPDNSKLLAIGNNGMEIYSVLCHTSNSGIQPLSTVTSSVYENAQMVAGTH